MAAYLFRWRYRLASLFSRCNRCHTCPDCGAEIFANFKALKRSGHHRARVFYGRLALERRIDELYSRLPIFHVGDPGTGPKIAALHKHEIIGKGLARCLAKNWANSSKIVHGAPCSMDRASQVVHAIVEVLRRIEDDKLAPAKQLVTVTSSHNGQDAPAVDYEAEQLAEQFSDGILGGWGANAVVGFAGGAL
jgi:hypothetical protein